jgi:DNA modification methylase
MSKQASLDLSSKSTAPVECLGQSFPSDEARREHYLKLLAEKLKDPEFRKIEGFPIGEDEDILALSDPPYYTACPNPWIGDFIKHYGRPYDPKEKYHREPFAADVSEGKNHVLYKAHSYYTKVPHLAIVPSILHYTLPGDIVVDGFSGTGTTGVAVQCCNSEDSKASMLGQLNSASQSTPMFGSRKVILSDLSPYAAFISSIYNSGVNNSDIDQGISEILQSYQDKYGWMYKTICSETKKEVKFDYCVWSEIYSCPECGFDVPFLDSAYDKDTKKVKSGFPCLSCGAEMSKENSNLVFEIYEDTISGIVAKRPKRKLSIVAYKTTRGRVEKSPGDFDFELLKRIEAAAKDIRIPTAPFKFEDCWEAVRLRKRGVTDTHQLYLKRPTIMISALWEQIVNCRDHSKQRAAKFIVEQVLRNFSVMNSFEPLAFSQNARGQKSAFYIPSQHSEVSPDYFFNGKINTVKKALSQPWLSRENAIVGTCSATQLGFPDNSVDYVFTDPPFGENFPYAELNFFCETLHQVWSFSPSDAVVDRAKQNKSAQKSLSDYQRILAKVFKEYYRVLKPGRWMTVVFSNTSAAVWNSIQSSLQEAGFVVANVSALDKKQGSFKAVTTPTAVKQDLVISAYKPDEVLEDRFRKSGQTAEGVWDFMRNHLRNLPIIKPRGGELEFIAERDPRILYDRMVAFYVGHGVPVPLSSAEFQATLAEKFPEREGMFFLPDQVDIWDKKRAQVQGVGQMSIFVEDEKSAIDWLRSFLKNRPSVAADITPEFMQQLGASWKKFETRPELRVLLEQNFLKYDGNGEVPGQIHGYLSTQFKDLRNLAKDDSHLQSRSKDRWYVPDPGKAVDVEAIRNKRLLAEFWDLCAQAGINRPASEQSDQGRLPFPAAVPAKKGARKKLKEVRTEAVRLGFKECFAAKNYATILALSEHLPENVIEEDEQLQMIHDMAEMRSGN